MNKQVCILGCNIVGLYSALRCIELGYSVCIIDKQFSAVNTKINNYELFNKSHTIFMQLLKKFNVNYSAIAPNINHKLQMILAHIIARSKIVPKKSLYSQSFAKFAKTILSAYDYDILQGSLQNFEYIYNNMNAMDAIYLFTNDISNNQEYFVLTDQINVLISRLVAHLQERGAVFILNTDIKDIKYVDGQIHISSANATYIANVLIITISKKNVQKFKIFKDQKQLLNNITNLNINIASIYNIVCAKNTSKDTDGHLLLDNMHITYPIDKTHHVKLPLWNIGINSIIIREKIKHIMPSMFICNETYAKNPFFINHSLELIENIIPKIIQICSYCGYASGYGTGYTGSYTTSYASTNTLNTCTPKAS